ncbi:MAG: hypothetical protein OHK0022_46150 [Roseiflexaceae bacterium]
MMAPSAAVLHPWSLLDALPEGLAVVDAAGLIRYANRAAGLPQGGDYLELLSGCAALAPAERATLAQGLRAICDGVSQRHEQEWASPDRTRWWSLSGTPLAVEGGYVALVQLHDISAARLAEQALRASEERFQRIAGNLPGMLYQFVLHPDGSGAFPYVSEGCRELFDIDPAVLAQDAAPLVNLIHPEDMASFQESVMESAQLLKPWRWEGRFVLPDGRLIWTRAASRPERLPEGGWLWDGMLLDIGENKQAEQIIQMQAATLQELSTPVIPLNDSTIVLPLIGTVDSQRAQQVMDTLLTGVQEHRARFAILDITGVTVVDTQVANALIRAAQATQLLGARVILTGIRPEIAQTLVGLGVNLSSVVTLSTLQRGIAFAISQG